MAERDSAFLWETEAIRNSPRAMEMRFERSEWLTLREAEAETGIPLATLRKWARRGSVPSFLREGPEGQLRMVSRQGIRDRARELGRQIRGGPSTDPAPSPSPTPPAPRREPRHLAPNSPVATPPDAEMPQPAPGTMLIPIDAWEKMLLQLGNLHQAGQELAEARERAAKAETEVRFLKERLVELRSHEANDDRGGRPSSSPSHETAAVQSEEAESPSSAIVEPPRAKASDAPAGESEGTMDLAGYSQAVFKHLYATWRNRPRR